METAENQDLQLAFDFVRFTNRNVFLTGKAGTGKTTFLRELKNLSPKRQVIVAPTGVAAINAGGVTIHSFFQLPFHPYIPVFYLPGTDRAKQAGHDDHGGYKLSREKISIIKSLDLLIIDEISMVRADTLDAIDSALRRYKNRYLPFGGIQLLMIGDLQQLAPVVKDDDREILSKYYDSFFFFGSRALAGANYLTIELKHIYRQSDQAFIRLLNKVRENKVDEEVMDELNKRYIPDFDPDTGGGYITLTTHNNQARTINDSKLGKLPGETHTFTAMVRDEFPELSFPNDAELILKEGAQVMFIKNDLSPDKLFFNGKIGKIEGFEEDAIIVKCPDDELPIYVERAEWQNVRYTLDEETKELDETVIGTFTQYPLRLAWAITIHKSQGLTFDRAVIDARSAFAHGQVYVALSRCRTLDGIVLSSRIYNRSIIDNPAITGFINESVQKQPGQQQLTESKKAYQQQLLSELFDFTGILQRLSYCQKIVNEHTGSIIGDTSVMLEKSLSALKTDVIEVSGKFQLQLKELLNSESDPEENMPLQERVRKAAAFFYEKLKVSFKEILSGYKVETDNRTIRRSVNEAFERTAKECLVKLECLDSAKTGFQISSYLNARAKSLTEIPATKAHSRKEAKDASVVTMHPDLYMALKDWRSIKAREQDVPHYRVMHQKTLLAISNKLPRTMATLGIVRGIGAKTIREYGEELLELINAYCEMENIEAPENHDFGPDPEKKKKVDTKKITMDLFRQGNTPAQIAEIRKLSLSTIEGHLACFVGTGEIAVTEFVPKEIVDLITNHFVSNGDLKIGPVKEALGEKVSWGDIRFVASHLKHIQ